MSKACLHCFPAPCRYLASMCLSALVFVASAAGQTDNANLTADKVKQIPDLELWVAAEDLQGQEGDAVTKWPDRTSHHWDLTSAGGNQTLALKGINGKPAVHFDGSQNGKNDGPFGAMLTDAKFFDATWKGPMSIFLVARQDINPGPEFHETAIWTADSPSARDKLSGLIWGNREGFWMNVHWIKDLWNCQCGDPLVTNVYGVSHDGASEQDWINGMEYSRPQVKGSPQSRGPFCLGNHILYHNGYAQFGGYIAEVLIFKRGLTRQECQAVNHYLLQKYGKTGKQIVLEGHSQFNTLAWQLGKRLPDWDINNVAIGGTGLHAWADQVQEKFEGAYRPGVANIAIVAGGDNTVGTDDAQVERAQQNYQRWSQALRAKGWKTIVSTTPPRSPHPAYPLYEAHRRKLNAWLRVHYQEFADGLYDIDNIKQLGDPKDLKYYKPDGVHLTVGAYELTADEIARVVRALGGADSIVKQGQAPGGDASPKRLAVKPRKLALDAASVEVKLVSNEPQALPGANGALILEVTNVTAGRAHLMLYVSGRGPKDGVFVFNEMRARKGQDLALFLPDERYVVSVRDVVHSATGKSHLALEIAVGAVDEGTRALPAEGRLSDAEEAEIRQIEARAKQFSGVLSGVSWFMIHAADEKKKMEALQAVFSTKHFSEDDQCDLGTAIRRAGGTVNYRKSLTALLSCDDLAVRSIGAVWLGVVGDPNSAADLIALVRAKDLPVQEKVFQGADRRWAAVGLGILGAKQHAKELAGLLRDGNAAVRAGAAAALGCLAAQEYAAPIAALLDDEEAGPIFAAIAALAQLGAKQYTERIAGLLRSPAKDVSIPDAALAALMELDAKDQIDKIAAFRKSEVFHSGTAAKALAVLGAKQYAQDIAGMLKGGEGPGELLARRDALLALGILQAKAYAGDVVKLLTAKEDFLQRAAAWSLILMEDEAYGARALGVLEDEYYGSPLEISPHDLDYVPGPKFLEIQRRARESLLKFQRGGETLFPHE